MAKVKDLKLKFIITISYIILVVLLNFLGVECLFKHFFNIECPGCGMTRAIIAAINFDFKAAFAFHSMFWSIPILYAYFICEGNLFTNKKINSSIFGLLVLGFVINWLIC